MVLALEREPRQERRWGWIVARAWDDAAFRRRLLAEPACVLREEGIDVPAGAAVRVIEGESAGAGEEETCFWLPPSPDGAGTYLFERGGSPSQTEDERAIRSDD